MLIDGESGYEYIFFTTDYLAFFIELPQEVSQQAIYYQKLHQGWGGMFKTFKAFRTFKAFKSFKSFKGLRVRGVGSGQLAVGSGQ